ncbi:MAG: MlaD family protein [Halioglobus sp.]|jgi:paraquat-inducible protein B|uniref:MlaD family protein n=1 Tax=Halioglobus sp. Uisw_031 TaxID=3230977 RepID=UPI003591F64F|tara:strand:- start:94 stop:1059 length:966 start_codon:yes stop_codon:yes gene_type:complete
MSEKPHTVAIGAFVLGAILIAVATVLLLMGSGFGTKETVVMVFDGSVKGLSVGAPLALRGVKVGEVTDIDLVLDSDTASATMIVEANFNKNNIRQEGDPDVNLTEELIKSGLRAQLNTQSLLTGLLYIELDFHPKTAAHLVKINSPYLQIPTIETDLERFTKTLQNIDFSKLNKQVENISSSIDSLVSSKDFQALPAGMNTTLTSLRELSTQLQGQLATSGPKLDILLDETSVTVNNVNKDLPQLSALVESNLAALNAAILTFQHGMTGIDALVSPDSAVLYRLNNALAEMTRAGRSLQSLASTLEEQPESVIIGKRGGKK